MRDGYVARWRGVEYDASPDGAHVRLYSPEPGEGFVEVADGRYRRGVLFGEIEDFRYVRTTCSWRGEPFLVLGEFGSWLRLEYTGGDASVAHRLGLEPYDAGVYQIWVPRGEAENVTEVRL
ncbi:hypothetical protein FB566_2050 [Stackebrandtia endophytica]|uniref:Uncharacterized protein n=1 Tax=Stackebrandtia endophytica TaxID=1496996 RepID=A0A543AVA8_9ACTN|nr:hypothetical protein [Stackebrandtia endophytica]TQL76518.1 hypothetical protein FB566_2050 [Stackebrandtia endophytica]